MESIIAMIQQWISSGSLLLAAGGAFAGGILAGLCPCVIMMVPLLIGFIGGMGGEMTTKRSFLFAMVFILGFSLELALLFTVGLAAAPFLQSQYMTYFVAAICVLLGLHFMGVVKIPIGKIQHKAPKHTGFLGAALFGFMFGFTSMPCTGPVLLLLVSVIPAMDPVVGGITMNRSMPPHSHCRDVRRDRKTDVSVGAFQHCEFGISKSRWNPSGLGWAVHRSRLDLARTGTGFVIKL